jgi:hypothetical protein
MQYQFLRRAGQRAAPAVQLRYSSTAVHGDTCHRDPVAVRRTTDEAKSERDVDGTRTAKPPRGIREAKLATTMFRPIDAATSKMMRGPPSLYGGFGTVYSDPTVVVAPIVRRHPVDTE